MLGMEPSLQKAAWCSQLHGGVRQHVAEVLRILRPGVFLRKPWNNEAKESEKNTNIYLKNDPFM